MSYDFDYYSGADLKYPSKPTKPTLGRNPTAVDARAFADALEEYERALESYKEDKSYYNECVGARMNELREKLMKDYGMCRQEFDVIWNKAWEFGNGLSEVYFHFDSLFDFVIKYNNAMKGI